MKNSFVNIIGAIEEKLQRQKDDIFLRDYEIKKLENKLKEAYAEIEQLKGAKE